MSKKTSKERGPYWVSGDFSRDWAIRSALKGSRPDSLALLKRFADNPSGSDTALINYVGHCIREWAKYEFKPTKAPHAFHLSRPKHGPGVKGTREKHIGIVETYLRLRAQGLPTGKALGQTAKERNCGTKLVEKLIVGLHNDTAPFTTVHNVATRRLLVAADFDYAPLRRALGAGWDKWVRDARASEARWLASLRDWFPSDRPRKAVFTLRKSSVK